MNKFINIHSPSSIMGVGWPSAQEHPLFYIGIYAAIGLGTAFVSVASYIAQFTGALRASRLLFKRLLIGVVKATMRWHDVTPQGANIAPPARHIIDYIHTGRLLNRFGKVGPDATVLAGN
jgi:hypothetical protein